MNCRSHRNAIHLAAFALGIGATIAPGFRTAARAADGPHPAPANPATRGSSVQLPRTSAPAAASSVAKPATADEIRSAYEAGRWDDVLRALPTVLSLKGKAAEDYDRHGLLRFKGEALLHTRATAQAAAAFRQAGELAPDPSAAAVDRATALLLQRSTAGATFQPRRPRPDGGNRPAIDVLAPESRKAALAALFEDELAARGPQIEAAAATEVRSFDGIDPLLLVLRDLRALELAATDDDKIIADLTVGIDVKAARMLKASMEPVAASAQRVRDKATAWRRADGFFIAGQQFGIRGPTITPSTELASGPHQARAADKQVGLTTDTAGELRRVMVACRNVADRAAACGEAFGGRQAEFEDVRRQAEETGAAAAKLLGTDWRAVRVRLRPLVDEPKKKSGG